MKQFSIGGVAATLCLLVCSPAQSQSNQVSGANCSFIAHRDEFLSGQARARQDVVARVSSLNTVWKGVRADSSTVPPSSLPHRNFIDDIVFGGLVAAKIPAAPLSTDEEFLRRITLDLTGRIPSSTDVKAFVADATANKRDLLIETLLSSPEYTDKWTMWLGDLVQNVSSASNVNLTLQGRDYLLQLSANRGGQQRLFP